MIQENEIIMLALGALLFLFVVTYKQYFDRIPQRKFLLLSFYILLAALLF